MPRRSAFPSLGLRPRFGLCPLGSLHSSKKQVAFTQFYLTARKQPYVSPFSDIQRDSQALYITVVTSNRLPVFKTDQMKAVLCRALDEARKSAGFLLFAYVIMIIHWRRGRQRR